MVDRSWFERDAPIVAPELLNKVLVTGRAENRTSGRIIEVEAYMPDDPASHTFRGPTHRNEVMFGPAGHLYVYLSYGIHHCVNVVTGPVGSGQAVLIRAVVPMEGKETIRLRRSGVADRSLADGPGKLAQALGIGLECDAVDLLGGADISIIDDGVRSPDEPVVGPRIGITKGTETLWRFRVPIAEHRSRTVTS